MGRNIATLEEIFKIDEILKKEAWDHEQKDYKPGFDDEVVAKKVGCSLYSVRRIRSERYGLVRNNKPDLLAKIHALELRVEELEKHHVMPVQTRRVM